MLWGNTFMEYTKEIYKNALQLNCIKDKIRTTFSPMKHL